MKATLIGLEQTNQALDKAAMKARRKGTRRGITKATRVVAKAAKAKARKVSGLLKKSIGRKTRTYKGTGKAVGIVGPRVGFGTEVTRNGQTRYSDPARYGHLVEHGTTHSAAVPFLGPALAESTNRVKELIAQSIREALGQ